MLPDVMQVQLLEPKIDILLQPPQLPSEVSRDPNVGSDLRRRTCLVAASNCSAVVNSHASKVGTQLPRHWSTAIAKASSSLSA